MNYQLEWSPVINDLFKTDTNVIVQNESILHFNSSIIDIA